MSINACEQMATGVSDITSIALVTLEVIHNALLINELRLRFAFWELLCNPAARWTIVWSFTLRSFNCVFTILADSWSLKGMTTRVVFSVVDLDSNGYWLATFRFRKVLTVESTRCLEYFNLENTDYSSMKYCRTMMKKGDMHGRE